MATLNFSINQNQSVWESWFEEMMDIKSLDADKVKAKRVSLSQYKPIVKELEAYTNKPFNELTVNDLNTFVQQTTKQDKINHLRGFLITIATKEIEALSKDVLAWLIPDMYKDLVSLILK